MTDMLDRYGLNCLVTRRLSELPYGLRKLLDLLRAYVGNNTPPALLTNPLRERPSRTAATAGGSGSM